MLLDAFDLLKSEEPFILILGELSFLGLQLDSESACFASSNPNSENVWESSGILVADQYTGANLAARIVKVNRFPTEMSEHLKNPGLELFLAHGLFARRCNAHADSSVIVMVSGLPASRLR